MGNPVCRVEILKETKGEFRKLGVPTVVDRVFQQAITQVLSPICEKQFSENGFGFRANRGAHDELKQCQNSINAGVISKGMFEKTEVGMPQGGPLSPLLSNIMPYIEGNLFLKVNRTKTYVAHISKVKYLGYSFYRCKGKCRFRVHPKSVTKIKNKIRELTNRSNGWVNYFGMADMKRLLQSNDEAQPTKWNDYGGADDKTA